MSQGVQLSTLLKHDRRTIGKRLQDIEPDKIQGKRKLYSLAKVRDLLTSRQSQSNEKQRYEIEKLIKQCEQLEIKNDELRKRLTPTEEVTRTWLAHVRQARQVLLQIPELAPVISGLKPVDIKTKLTEAVESVISELHDNPVSTGPYLNLYQSSTVNCTHSNVMEIIR